MDFKKIYIDTSEIDNLITGRARPRIYAFTTETIPNYLKVGDTCRPVDERMTEWMAHYPDLKKQRDWSAEIEGQDKYFRDHTVHKILKEEKGKVPLDKSELREGVYFSKEFFGDTTADEVEEAIDEIQADYRDHAADNTLAYKYYSLEDRTEVDDDDISPTEDYPLRGNQKDVVERFVRAVGDLENPVRNNLLMYAVMRFGKSFTSMCCAKAVGAKLVVIVSAKADVKAEWRRTILSHKKLAFYDGNTEGYHFYTATELAANPSILDETEGKGECAVVFVTLQDLSGTGKSKTEYSDEIKKRHRQLFDRKIDLLIVDETHFGARGEKIGDVLRHHASEDKDDDAEDTEEIEKLIKELDRKVTLHLSGTPYRILLDDNEFKKEDIVAFCQFSDIVKTQEEWDAASREKILSDEVKEWDNPYYGFPQMIRFAFNLNSSSRDKLKTLEASGEKYGLSTLLLPKSMKRTENGSHREFVYEDEVLDLLRVIDGSREDDCVLGFLDYEKIKAGEMCRHIVMVLPYKASCDAMEELIKAHRDEFKNLKDYAVINISGVDRPRAYSSVSKVKSAIKRCERTGEEIGADGVRRGGKTITLTVNRMLTGSTVEEWDTMLYMKGTESPQEYDQAIFRLQNQYVRKYTDPDGNEIKINMKPQTLLVDFDPTRMFVMQEERVQTYGFNTDGTDDMSHRERLSRELDVSPVITLNARRMTRIEPADIMKAVSEYSKGRGIKDEALGIPVDLAMLDDEDIRSAMDMEHEIGGRGAMRVPVAKNNPDDDGTEIDVPETDGEKAKPTGEISSEGAPADDTPEPDDDSSHPNYADRIKNFHARILLYAFITEDEVDSLDDIIDSIDSEENRRTAKNIGLNPGVLRQVNRFYHEHNRIVLDKLNGRILNLNMLSTDGEKSPKEKVATAMKKFGKLDDAIVITPFDVCGEMLDLIPDRALWGILAGGKKILDPASSAGEFAVALLDRIDRLESNTGDCLPEDVKTGCICSVPKSSVCYELTRKMYKMAGLDLDNVASDFTAFDLTDSDRLGVTGAHVAKRIRGRDKVKEACLCRVRDLLTQDKKFKDITLGDTVITGGDEMKFGVVVSNPPYQANTGSKSQAVPLYPKFVEMAKKINPEYITMIMPSRWYAGGMGLDDFRSVMLGDRNVSTLVDYTNAKECFPYVSIGGGVCYFLRDRDNPSDACEYTNIHNGVAMTEDRALDEFPTFIRFNQAVPIIRTINALHTKEEEFMPSIASSLNPFGLGSNVRGSATRKNDDDCVVHSSAGVGYIPRSEVTQGRDLIDRYKIMISKTTYEHASETDKNGQYRVISRLELLEPGEVCTFSYFVIGDFGSDESEKAENLLAYLKTKFVRFLLLQTVSSINLTRDKFQYIPLQDFSRPWTDEDLFTKYGVRREKRQFIDNTMRPMK